MTSACHRALAALIDLVFPPHCVSCRRHGEWFCTACQSRISPMTPPLCPRCGQTLLASGRCASCIPAGARIGAIRSLGPYDAPLREAIVALKFQGMRVLAGPLARLLAELWDSEAMPVDVVVPVPLHRARERARGYNQAALLAREFGRLTGLPVREDLVLKRRHTRPQVGLKRQERLQNVRGAFFPGAALTPGTRVLLIDDVLTTGATLEACAEPLFEAGAGAVYALTLARATLDDSRLFAGEAAFS